MMLALVPVTVVRDVAIVAGALVTIATALRLAIVRQVLGVMLAPFRWLLGHAVADLGAVMLDRANVWLDKTTVGRSVHKMDEQIDAINNTLNHRPPGAPTISQDITEIRERLASGDVTLEDHRRLLADHGDRLGHLEHPPDG